MAQLSAHLSLGPAKGVRSFLATTPHPQLDLQGVLQRTGEGLGDSPWEKLRVWAQRPQEGLSLKDGSPVCLLEPQCPTHLKSADPLSFRGPQHCLFPSMSVLASRKIPRTAFRV